jgi:signal transduction histidine kinase
MSVMVVQAGAARTVIDRDPEAAKAAIARIEETGRDGLTEMRRLIGVLTDPGTEPDLAPQPGLAQLDALLETVRGAGVPVEAVTRGQPHPLPPSADLIAYRVVQEALTNVVKHAPGAHARVLLDWSDDALAIEVADDGRGGDADATGGHGLIGMRERVALHGGSLETGVRPGGGFAVRVRLPLGEGPAS